MRAIKGWRFAPRIRTKAGSQPAVPVPPEFTPPELQKRMRTAFERARPRKIQAQAPQEALEHANDPWIRRNSAAFLILEGERRGLEARLGRPYWRRRDHHRDLVLITKLIHLEYEHLAGHVSRRASPPSLPNGSPALNVVTPADWAQPWGCGPMLEMRTTLTRYRDRGDRLARHLPAPVLARSTADAERYRDRVWGRFEIAMQEEGGREQAPAVALAPRRSAPRPLAGLVVRPWAGRRPGRAAALAALAASAAVVGVLFAGSRTDSTSVPSSAPVRAVVASVPDHSLTSMVEKRSQKSPPARDRRAAQRSRDSSAPPTRSRSAPPAVSQTELTSSEVSPAPSEPAPQPAPAPAPAPSSAPAPTPQPAPSPQPASNPEPGPVHSLPSPVHTLPNPGGGG